MAIFWGLGLDLGLDGLKDLKNCGFKTKNALRLQFLDQKVFRPVLDLKDLKILILDEVKFQFLRS